ncbi:peptidase M16 [Endomicrobiia bacterium]|uniref:Peptidase M16 family zinc protease n=1 Tax=Endomicrobium trichonymphae TaxID=1408204 RepID=B1GZ66_ENDTX|nr:pitrilysin family protein [Candidatus Endomicrobium trichonymphae]GHT10252.1 peptidase M16 [Endomicrobiia bacterium]BAG13548.1 peptidase M16 family zinc protease [Candidatus Endomicrobium trichonymphae]BAV58630.1 zinc protease [Candidatus Endomicrobium trichonymphae]GHT17652.1 peptidase M16 [Endomicrobiia bacterium]GHT22290.1 peptidase M16 [Endomicrobiia bacterium]
MKYENGLTSILINNKNTLTATAIVFVRVGSVDEKPFQSGLSHFLEHLMFKGSKNYRGDLMGRNVENMGGYINAATAKEFTMYYINIQKDGLGESIKMLADAMQNPLFPQDEIDRERKVVIEEIQRHSDNPAAVIYEKFYETVYEASALKNSIIGTPQVVANVSREEIYGYYKTHYIPAKMIVVVSGNFDETAVEKLIGETFGKFEEQSASPDPMLFEKVHDGKDIIEYGKVETGYMLTGFLGPAINEEDIYTADTAVNILGSGKSSRLYKALYEKKHLVYSTDSYFMTEKGTGNICIISVFDSKNLKKIKDEIKKQIEYIIDGGIAEEELNRATLSIKTNWNFSLETPFGTADNIGYWHLMDNPKFVTEHMKKIESMTVSDIINFFKKYYSPATVSNIALLPSAATV